MKKVYVLWWGYRGGDMQGIVRVFTHRAAADAMLEVLVEQSDARKYKVDECELVEHLKLEG